MSMNKFKSWVAYLWPFKDHLAKRLSAEQFSESIRGFIANAGDNEQNWWFVGELAKLHNEIAHAKQLAANDCRYVKYVRLDMLKEAVVILKCVQTPQVPEKWRKQMEDAEKLDMAK